MEVSTQLKNNPINHLLTSRVRVKILEIFLLHPNDKYYVRQVTRMVDEEVNAVRRELERLRDVGLLGTEHRANRLYYSLKTDFPLYYELLRIFAKSAGFGKSVISVSTKIGQMKYAAISLKFLSGRPSGPDDIDAIFVGEIELEGLQKLIRSYEKELGKEINYTIMNEEEFVYRKERADAFIMGVLAEPKVLLVGDEIDFSS